MSVKRKVYTRKALLIRKNYVFDIFIQYFSHKCVDNVRKHINNVLGAITAARLVGIFILLLWQNCM